jgi:hypothetical protein
MERLRSGWARIRDQNSAAILRDAFSGTSTTDPELEEPDLDIHRPAVAGERHRVGRKCRTTQRKAAGLYSKGEKSVNARLWFGKLEKLSFLMLASGLIIRLTATQRSRKVAVIGRGTLLRLRRGARVGRRGHAPRRSRQQVLLRIAFAWVAPLGRG